MLSTTVTATLLASLAVAAPAKRQDEHPYSIEWRANLKGYLGDVATPDPNNIRGTHENGNVLGIAVSPNQQGNAMFRRIRTSFALSPSKPGPIRSLKNHSTDDKGPEHCLDGTSNPQNGAVPHFWDCYEGLDVQQWQVRPDGLIELAGTGLCLDYKDGKPTPDQLKGEDQATIQLWACDPNNTNQQWNVQQ
ncbi:20 kDa protein having G-X-X-X-Q-X-W- motif protein [Trichosporon asahii var. asahii CBS 8904]|uniref:20 kDa protein having G-X-X-X-Q-X-W-motif protein n=1 Tax=Trichosporon asahii var. asahii (strain CBS 8904) TaxID=1220162 RepID=K1W149_TRIAC|nr:20 kDa protein having G-X-X-X-Q-X-W- motif protein [Trichosporon asahii var. asahii CBS 8904]